MARQHRYPLWFAGLVFVAIGVLSLSSCGDARRESRRSMMGAVDAGDVYLRSVADTLNDLPANIDLELQPAQPILTASTSADGKEVLAVCIENPNNPDGTYNYLLATTGNANFYSIDVQPGDIIRYYVNVDEESAERGIEQRTALELRVRRLDSRNPENALIIEGGLTAPAEVPQRVEIWRYSDKRMDAIRSALNRYVTLRLPPIGWEPAPDVGALQQIVERANQWLRNEPDDPAWKREPMLVEATAALPQPQTDPQKRAAGILENLLSSEGLRDGNFLDWEGRLLAEAVWLRDIAQWARGSAASDLDVAAALFDWTVRNIQLDAPDDPMARNIHHPWQAIMYGHGSAAHRAWVFIELCRQQNIDAVLVQPAPKAGAAGAAPLLVGVLVEDRLHLFDPTLGLPLPGEETAIGKLAELSQNDALLRQFDLEGGPAYPLSADQLKQVDVFVVASHLQLARRAQLLEKALEGEDFVELAVDPAPLAEKVSKLPQVKSTRLWVQPFQAILDQHTLPNTDEDPQRQLAAAEFAPLAERPLLWKARVLHFQGNKGARADERNDPLAEEREGHEDAVRLYRSHEVRPSNAELAELELNTRTVRAAGKAAAGYWLGLLSYDRGNYEVALQWLGDRTLEETRASRWADGARYNLARTYEAMGNLEEAVRLLRSDPEDAPQRQGNLLRARRLEAEAAEKADETEGSSEPPAG
ncbi:MAG TPA: hypothetical protein VF175_03615 [Lacipirellula sp.]